MNYDHDEKGFISQEDFEKIAASFPFSFCVTDKDKWVSDTSFTGLTGCLTESVYTIKPNVCGHMTSRVLWVKSHLTCIILGVKFMPGVSRCQTTAILPLQKFSLLSDLLSLYLPCYSIQRRTHQQRRDHSVFHESQRHLFQTRPRFLSQLSGNHIHEAYLLWQLLRICKSH